MFLYTSILSFSCLSIDIKVANNDVGLIAGVISAIFVIMGLFVVVVAILVFMKMK